MGVGKDTGSLFGSQQIYFKNSAGKMVPANADNPLPFSLADLGLVLGVDIQGIKLVNPGESLPVTVVGGSAGGGGASGPAIEITTLVNGDQLRVTTEKTITLPSLLNYKRYVIQVFNGTDADIKVVPWNTNVAVLDDGSIGGFSTATTEDTFAYLVPKKNGLNNGVFYLNELDPKQNGSTSTKKVKDPGKLFENRFNSDGAYTLAYKAVAAPTNNGITIKLIGWLK